MSSRRDEIPPEVLAGLSEKTRACLDRLRRHTPDSLDLRGTRAQRTRSRSRSGRRYGSDREPTCRPDVSHTRRAAVLLLLFEREGKLRVLLTTRSQKLRSHPGQTALPGGKVDDTDADAEHTARREAFEEVGLPIDSPHVHHLCRLRTFLSASRLHVTPVVVFLSDPSLLEHLNKNAEEVDCIFDWPFEAILDPELLREEEETLVPRGSEHWFYDKEFHTINDVPLDWLGGTHYRNHRFRSSASPVKGLTADILIVAAQIAYDRPASFEPYAPDQLFGVDAVSYVQQPQTKQKDIGA
ncbi:hypothetical protein PUNSTDRAFT_47242 [Punctularia strigosozonata HHB-11173 SS5]|uniref:Nudix hydrolase domain-containing protein n=1 Tax=Punctularia strigosozonata (strain HHB-11173) TaxID=741275 RepID=R7S564_PUNST|nr:uncharacterized protein PUNSTDRAFT_47242 [Punctularia strigosozonata HHB-11173 SS5]EIN05012.1 hypothetical protein PUNSTDRAFT_47242 [Punctularia strigosozonata HHB-11173 SS5]